jgi:hypothetical protein
MGSEGWAGWNEDDDFYLKNSDEGGKTKAQNEVGSQRASSAKT